MRERLLPSEVAHLKRDHLGNAGLDDVQPGSADNRLDGNRHVHDAGPVRIIELVGVTDQLVQDQFEILATERMPVAGREIAKGHPEVAAHPRLHVVNRAGEAEVRKPLRQGIGFKEGAIELLGLGLENAVEANAALRHKRR